MNNLEKYGCHPNPIFRFDNCHPWEGATKQTHSTSLNFCLPEIAALLCKFREGINSPSKLNMLHELFFHIKIGVAWLRVVPEDRTRNKEILLLQRNIILAELQEKCPNGKICSTIE